MKSLVLILSLALAVIPNAGCAIRGRTAGDEAARASVDSESEPGVEKLSPSPEVEQRLLRLHAALEAANAVVQDLAQVLMRSVTRSSDDE